MKMSNSEIVKILMQNDHLSEEDKKVLLSILGFNNDSESKVSLGDRLSDSFTNFIGSWKFISISIAIIFVWILLNSCLLPVEYVFDEFPYVLLNLVLACIAAIQAPIIMMSQNRQDKRESLKTQSDYEIDLKTIVIIQDLYQKTIELHDKIDKINNMCDKSNNVIDIGFKGKKED